MHDDCQGELEILISVIVDMRVSKQNMQARWIQRRYIAATLVAI